MIIREMLHGTAVFYTNIYYYILQLKKHSLKGYCTKTILMAYFNFKCQTVFK